MKSHGALSLDPFHDMPGRQETDFVCITDSKVLVYLIHGITGAPVEMSSLSRKLSCENGWDVNVTTLPGHGTNLSGLGRTTEQDWRAHVQRQLSFIRDRYEYVFAVGLGAGALLALEASTVVRVDGIGALSPTFIHNGWNTPWAQVPERKPYHARGTVRGRPHDWCARGKVANGAATPPSSATTIAYPAISLGTLTEIDRLIMRVLPGLHDVTTPTVILQARTDDMTNPRNSSIVYNAISSQDRLLIVLDDCFHVVSVGDQQEAVAAHMAPFFRLHMKTEFIPQQMMVNF
ncbi:MAG: alpha/beta hydrolase [Nitrospiraceae bacterium]|nr:alpha/beta hydrolase [Nitrospira sp.]MCA9455076.1 alpha/beta hydrolase [Nitrospira sp.]MCB9776034.1 alpha/beta hydrolase [Nitrospiraceae bacterium]